MHIFKNATPTKSLTQCDERIVSEKNPSLNGTTCTTVVVVVVVVVVRVTMLCFLTIIRILFITNHTIITIIVVQANHYENKC